MDTIEHLTKKLDEIEGLLHFREKALSDNPDNFALVLSVQSLAKSRQEIWDQLKAEKLQREREIIELRLKGKSVNDGSVPLDLVGELSKAFSQAIAHGANQLQLGRKAKKKVPKEITDSIDLRLASISTGSARLFITGRSSPDLFGNSLLEGTLHEIFALLSSQSGNELTDKVGLLGSRTAEAIIEFLHTIVSHEIEVDASWNSPTNKSYMWSGDTAGMLRLSASLSTLVEGEPETLKFSGELVTISMKGIFELMGDDGVTLKGTFPADLLSKMQQKHIGEHCTGEVSRVILTNKVTRAEKIIYLLQGID
jgi:hypothetical protein